MSTQGAYGFRIGGRVVAGYNKFSSSPEGFGVRIAMQWQRLRTRHGNRPPSLVERIAARRRRTKAADRTVVMAREALASIARDTSASGFDRAMAQEGLSRLPTA